MNLNVDHPESINMDVDRIDLVNMLCGTELSIERCVGFEANGWMDFEGDQHNGGWKWNRHMLINDPAFTIEALHWLYKQCKS